MAQRNRWTISTMGRAGTRHAGTPVLDGVQRYSLSVQECVAAMSSCSTLMCRCGGV